ncbi:MAG: hypothetical protein HQK96_01750 [Nitrospirae bacterium]|nr:hypothetical protein [Nitrospirota bacterium]
MKESQMSVANQQKLLRKAIIRSNKDLGDVEDITQCIVEINPGFIMCEEITNNIIGHIYKMKAFLRTLTELKEQGLYALLDSGQTMDIYTAANTEPNVQNNCTADKGHE